MNEYEKNKTCCFIGHRKINETDKLKSDLQNAIEDLIVNKGVNNFLFGSKSEFNDLCFNAVSDLKRKYPHINRIYVRAEYPYISNDYLACLLDKYEDTYYPKNIENSGRAVYIKRNYEMINKSGFCICYYDESYAPPHRPNSDYHPKSGTKIAYQYALKNCGAVINIFVKH